jgi:formate/nitrite transporter FocA (FNT family)
MDRPFKLVELLWNNLLPVTIGNVLGGSVFVGMSYWAPICAR